MADRRLPIPEIVVPEHRLGRHINHDPQSLAYKVTPRGTPESVFWQRVIPVQDQGNLGRCVPTSAIGCLGTEPFYSLLPSDIKVHIRDETSYDLYREVTRSDPFPGVWEPDDTGSDGLSIAKVLHKRKWISGYQHITSLEAAWTAIKNGPFITGLVWMSGMDEPNSEGIVFANGYARGGHEFEVAEYDAARGLWGCWNSWGLGYGRNGKFYIPDADYQKLLGMQGDATSFVPITAPPPTPTPTPEPVDLLATFPYDKVDAWAAGKRYWWSKRNKTAAESYLTWRKDVK